MSSTAVAAGGPASGDAAVLRARAARAYLRAHRRRRRPSLYSIYLLVISLLVLGVFGEPVLATIVGGGIRSGTVGMVGPVAVTLVLVAVLRFGVWQGPVSFSVPDVSLVLVAPVAVVELVRPKLDHALLAGAVAGGVLGAAAVLLSAGGVDAIGAPRAAAVVVGAAALGAACVAGSWLVETSPAIAGRIARAGSWLVLAGLVPLVAAAGSVAAIVVGWSGPWGWAVAPLDDRAGWPLASAALLVAACGACVVARRRAGVVPLGALEQRAHVRSGIAAAAFTLDYRGAALVRRGAAAGAPGRAGVRPRLRWLRAPRTVIAWRDAVALRRGPARAGWAAVLGGAGIVEAATHAGRGLPAFVTAIVLYGAAAALNEPLRAEVDDPDRGRLLLGRPFATLLLGHCAVPAVALWTAGALTVAGLVAAGVLGPAALVLLVTLLPAAVAVAVLGTALATRRGGRIGPELLARLLTLDPSSPMVLLGVLWLAPWLLVTAVTLTTAIALLGSVAAGHHPVVQAGAALTAAVVVVAVVLHGVARRSQASDV